MKIGIIGIGAWGKNLLRVFNDFTEVMWCSNKQNKRTQEWIKTNYKEVNVTFDYNEILQDDSVDAVAIATPVDTHFKIAQDALKSGKNVFLEKPMARNVKEAEELVSISRTKNKTLFIGYIYLYHPVFTRVKELILKDPVAQLEFNWDKFGTFNEDIIVDLLTHDIAIMLDLMKKYPLGVHNIMKKGILTEADIIKIMFDFNDGTTCLVNINRVHPQKSKQIRVVTRSGKMLYWMDNRLFSLNKEKHRFILLFENSEEPLKIESQEFINCCKKNRKPLTDGYFGLEVIKTIELIKNAISN